MTSTTLVTGATGFIGGHLVRRLLADGWTVHALQRPSSDVSELPSGVSIHSHSGGVDQLSGILATARPDVVFHLASLYLTDHRPDQIDDLVEANIRFPTRLAEAMAATGHKRLINTGTAWQNFRSDGYNPVNLYAATKQACMDLLRYYHDAQDLSVLTLKLFDTYGPGDKRRKLIRILLEAAQSGETLGMSPGEQVIDMLHVADVVEAFLTGAHQLIGSPAPLWEECFVSGTRLTLKELVVVIGEVAERPIQVEFGVRPYRSREVMAPIAPGPGRLLPGWEPRVGFREGLKQLLQEHGPDSASVVA